jgi:beta-glucosidase
MKLQFPPDFIFGTSTSAYQIETAFEHDWKGVRAMDGNIFDETTGHEKRQEEDVEIISSLAPNYRMSVMWSKLQRKPFGDFDEEAKKEYHFFLQSLKRKKINIMMVLHHFANPIWFADQGGWANEKNIEVWLDFARKVVNEYGQYVSTWNTFNEPNLYATMGFGLGKFPPFKRNILTSIRVIKNIGKAHSLIYDYLKEKFPQTDVGISHNCAVFSSENILGELPARIADYWFMEYLPTHFSKIDFFGMSYYARISHDPLPVTYLTTPEKIKKFGKDHDNLWEYYPQGLRECIDRYWKKYQKPIIITENGICTNDDDKRIASIKDYMKILHGAIHDGIDIRGYFHWSPWDNFEWSLGPTYRFGLYECDLQTKNRKKKPSANVYSSLAYTNEILVD